MSVAVLQGAGSRTLRLGAGHIAGTPLPGEPGNSGIAGHRDTFFRELKDIRANDEIQLQTAHGILHYEVDWVKVVGPDDISVLAPATESMLTLVTCYPFYFVVRRPNGSSCEHTSINLRSSSFQRKQPFGVKCPHLRLLRRAGRGSWQRRRGLQAVQRSQHALPVDPILLRFDRCREVGVKLQDIIAQPRRRLIELPL